MNDAAIESQNPPPSLQSARLKELALLFLRLGATAFGGPAAHIAMMEEEVVRRRQWMSREKFLDLLGATNLIPGPNSTELAIHIGHQRAGWAGLLVAGSCFIFPAFLIVMAIAWAYVSFGQLPQAAALLYGIKPVVIAVVVQALWGLSRTAVKTKFLAALGLVALVLTISGINELIVLFGAGLVASLFALGLHRQAGSKPPPLALFLGGFPLASGLGTSGAAVAAGAASSATTGAAAAFGLWPLFLLFAKIGSVLFGSGYVLLAFLRADLVERLHWLTESQLIDAVAVGQLTPGPVFTTATFIGYLLAGPAGATVATVGIFLPAFFFVALSAPWIPRLRQSPVMGAFLDAVNVASLSLMAVVTWQLGRAALVDWVTIALAVASAVLLIRTKVNSAWLVLGGAVAGLVASHLIAQA